MQTTEMLYCPLMGTRGPVPNAASAWREQHQHAVWVFNPWTGQKRSLCDIEQDPDGRLLLPPGEKPTAEWERHILQLIRAEGALGQFRLRGWAGRLDAQRLIVILHRGEQSLTFRLTEPKDEERYYQLLRLEVLRLALQ
ncbi:hypothetical protein ACNRBV_17575 [Ralstonia pseudosolanacearum]|uniref:hypothetical protein n=1 Tax=Ralstonia pseudosolanacearum TaxID=1310165 RepID=UPI0018A66DA1|nr:hypothetical protein [Ralstonia pseudosolanacearum]BCL91903.1 hypothetical protein MAFF211479_16040 [Ralstonia solanacearum]BCN04467.1 hypothetical protein RPSB_16040 [Ralstonia solanacearum]